jgi:hypothetical protein
MGTSFCIWFCRSGDWGPHVGLISRRCTHVRSSTTLWCCMDPHRRLHRRRASLRDHIGWFPSYARKEPLDFLGHAGVGKYNAGFRLVEPWNKVYLVSFAHRWLAKQGKILRFRQIKSPGIFDQRGHPPEDASSVKGCPQSSWDAGPKQGRGSGRCNGLGSWSDSYCWI